MRALEDAGVATEGVVALLTAARAEAETRATELMVQVEESALAATESARAVGVASMAALAVSEEGGERAAAELAEKIEMLAEADTAITVLREQVQTSAKLHNLPSLQPPHLSSD
jgi:hypothetical protein